MSLTAIYSKNKKRRGRSRYLLSVMVDVVKDGKPFPPKWSMSETETNGKSICASFQQILDWMKMKLSASTEKGGILKSFSKSAKVTCIWVKNADPSPIMR